ncbi:hypothetical protein BDZ45DRAFT_761148 [Acephala macrosclerotiorum]|nr:hypothetical protein BDZ45DRAFT_761148 [Acephala macrosclerotiorum]
MANEESSRTDGNASNNTCVTEQEIRNFKILFVRIGKPGTRLLESITSADLSNGRLLADIPWRSLAINVPIDCDLNPKFIPFFSETMISIKHSENPTLEIRRFCNSYNIFLSQSGIQEGEELSLNFSREPQLQCGDASSGSVCMSPSGSTSPNGLTPDASSPSASASNSNPSSSPLENMKESVEQMLGQLITDNARKAKAIEGEDSSAQADSQPLASKIFKDLMAKRGVEGKGKANERNEDANSGFDLEDEGKGKGKAIDETHSLITPLTLTLRLAGRVPIRLLNGLGESSWAVQNTPQAFTPEEQAFNERYAARYYRDEDLAQNPSAPDIGESSTAVTPSGTSNASISRTSNDEEHGDEGIENESAAIPSAMIMSAAPHIEEEAEDDTSSIITNPYDNSNLNTEPGHSSNAGMLRQVMHRPIYPQLIAPAPRLGAIGEPRPDPDLREREYIREVMRLRYPYPSVPRLSPGRVEAGRRAIRDLLTRMRGSRDSEQSFTQENRNSSATSAPKPKKRGGPPPNAPKEPKAMREQKMGNFTHSGPNALAFQTCVSGGRPGSFQTKQRPTQARTMGSFCGRRGQGANDHRAPSRTGQRSTHNETSGPFSNPLVQGANARSGPSQTGQRPTQVETSRTFFSPLAQGSNGRQAPPSMGQWSTQAGTSTSFSTSGPSPNAPTAPTSTVPQWRQAAPRPAIESVDVSARESSEVESSRAARSRDWNRDKEDKKERKSNAKNDFPEGVMLRCTIQMRGKGQYSNWEEGKAVLVYGGVERGDDRMIRKNYEDMEYGAQEAFIGVCIARTCAFGGEDFMFALTNVFFNNNTNLHAKKLNVRPCLVVKSSFREDVTQRASIVKIASGIQHVNFKGRLAKPSGFHPLKHSTLKYPALAL